MMNQEEHLQYFNKLFADASALYSIAEKSAQEYTDKYCQYKPGDKLLIKTKYGQEERAIVQMVKFCKHDSTIAGMAYLNVRPHTINWVPKQRRANINICNHEEIILKF